MREFLRGRASNRKARMYCAGCTRRVWDNLADDRSRAAVAVVETYADGAVGERERRRAYRGADKASRITHVLSDGTGVPGYGGLALAVAQTVRKPMDATRAQKVGLNAVRGFDGQERPGLRSVQAGLVRDIFGNTFRPATIDPSWLTPTAVLLAQAIYEARAFDRLPILADSLEEAGCDSADVLNHCRGDGPHLRGCWVVDLVLGKE